jgi:hypothetical protein
MPWVNHEHPGRKLWYAAPYRHMRALSYKTLARLIDIGKKAHMTSTVQWVVVRFGLLNSSIVVAHKVVTPCNLEP